MKVGVIVDNPIRDLRACLLVALELARVGCKVRLIPFDNAPYEAFRYAPDYLLSNYVRKTNEEFLKRILSANVHIGVLDTEGGLFIRLEGENNLPNFIKTLSSDIALNSNITDYFIWGEAYLEALRPFNIFRSDALRLTGSPRSDLLHDSFCAGAQKKQFILINTSFTLANPKYRSSAEEAEDLIIRFGYNKELVYEVQRAQMDLIDEFIQITIDLAKSLPSEKFILRPHPFESEEVYRKACSGLQNIEVRSDQGIEVWLRSAKALFHFECSTAMEAALMNVPALSLRSKAQIRPVESVSRVTDYCDGVADLKLKLNAILAGDYVYPQKVKDGVSKVIRDVFYRFDGESYKRITEQIVRSEPKGLYMGRLKIWKTYYYIRNLLKLLLGRTLIRDSKSIKCEEVDSFIKELDKINSELIRNMQIKVHDNIVDINKI